MGYIFVTRDEECVIVVVRREMYGLHFCNPRVLGLCGLCGVGGGFMGYTNGKNELKAFVGRVEMAMPFNPPKPLNSFNPKI